eukprot:Sspe_Gene.107994::Locus_87150_Transcript_1_1_Confidence_1.000_Length_1592::g.107994::m.107994
MTHVQAWNEGDRGVYTSRPYVGQRKYTFGTSKYLQARGRERMQSQHSLPASAWKKGLRDSRGHEDREPFRCCTPPARRPVSDRRAFGDPPPIPPRDSDDGRSKEERREHLQRPRKIDDQRREENTERRTLIERDAMKQREQGFGHSALHVSVVDDSQRRFHVDTPQRPQLDVESRYHALRKTDEIRIEENQQRLDMHRSPLRQRELKWCSASVSTKSGFPKPPEVTELHGRKQHTNVRPRVFDWEAEQKVRLQKEREQRREEETALAASQSPAANPAPHPASSRRGSLDLSLSASGSRRSPPRTPRGSSRTRRAPAPTDGRLIQAVASLQQENDQLRSYVRQLEGLPPEYDDDPSLPPQEREVRQRLAEAFLRGRVGSLSQPGSQGTSPTPMAKLEAKWTSRSTLEGWGRDLGTADFQAQVKGCIVRYLSTSQGLYKAGVVVNWNPSEYSSERGHGHFIVDTGQGTEDVTLASISNQLFQECEVPPQLLLRKLADDDEQQQQQQ